jgi:hypothetical protein
MTTARVVSAWSAGFGAVTSLAVVFFLAGAAIGEPQTAAPEPAVADEAALTKQIDQLVAKRWTAANIRPAARADDSEFFRRVYLDLTGRIPSVAEARTFLSDARPDKRRLLVDQLLASPQFVAHSTNLYRALLIPEANNNFLVRLQQNNFESWLKRRLTANVGYDELVRDLLTAPVGGNGYSPFDIAGGDQPNALAFYSAKEFAPESLAAGTARLFLGVSVECAQCHHHPFTDWKREQFWSFAAFYSGMRSKKQMDFLLPEKEEATQKSISIPGTDKLVQARFLDDQEPTWQKDATSRGTLAQWVTSPSNRYFSRAAVNRTWAYFFGTGLIEPVDDMIGPNTVINNAELLDLLATAFADHKFDPKFLIRALVATEAYQLTSAGRAPGREAGQGENVDETSLFVRMPLRGLTGEQLFDSIAMATGYRVAGGGGDDLLSAITGGGASPRSQFLAKFATSAGKSTRAQTSILQALSLMNGKVVADATSLQRSETLSALVDAPFLTTSGRIEALYLATLSRLPSARESDRANRFVEDAVKSANGTGADEAYNHALADLFWVLLNSSEFGLNH